MKKIIFLLIILIFVVRLHAQPFNFGISAGYNETGVYGTQGPTAFTNSSGFNAGVCGDYSWKCLTAESGLYFTTKGYNSYTIVSTLYSDGSVNYFSAKGKVSLNYLEIPLNVLYNFRMPIGKLFIGGGVFFDDPLSGTSKGTTTQFVDEGPATTNSYTVKSPIGSGANKFTSYTGFEATAGVRFKNRFLISLKVQGSFSNMFTDDAETTKTDSFKSAGYSISAGYMFL
jgi:hypothetical protein